MSLSCTASWPPTRPRSTHPITPLTNSAPPPRRRPTPQNAIATKPWADLKSNSNPSGDPLDYLDAMRRTHLLTARVTASRPVNAGTESPADPNYTGP